MEIKNKIALLQSFLILIIFIAFSISFLIILTKVKNMLDTTSNSLKINIELSRYKDFDKYFALSMLSYDNKNLKDFKTYLVRGVYEIQLFEQSIVKQNLKKFANLNEINLLTRDILTDYSRIENILLSIKNPNDVEREKLYDELSCETEKLKSTVETLRIKMNALYSLSKSNMNYYARYFDSLLLKIILYGFSSAIFIFLLGLFLNYSFAINITKPLLNLISVMKSVENGDFSRPIILPKTNDEISYLANAFKKMLKYIKDRDKELEIKNKNLLYQRDLVSETNKKLEELNNIKSKYLSNMGHELKTPLNSIIGYAQIIKEEWYDKFDDNNKKDIDLLIEQTRVLLKVINSILEISRLESGKVPIYIDYFYIEDVIKECYNSIQNELKNKNIYFDYFIADEVNYIKSDAEKLREILLNLITNSIKFTESGGIKIFVKKVRKIDYKKFHLNFEKNYVKFAVCDTGIGIIKENLEKVFEEFFQAHPEKKHLGSGLGLSIVKRLVNLLKGYIFIFSKVNKGTIVYIFLEKNKTHI